ncbi:hypothetical protein [Endozoicomonas sp.]|uniref:hypothetical protein n=1 Tax=Endozoicomonas sp. TaxID=1892382 RepID=UPI00383B2811
MKELKEQLPKAALKLSREDIIFTRHFFEHGDPVAATEAAGYVAAVSKRLEQFIYDPATAIGRFYWELCRDRVESTLISTEKKRSKIWELAEWSIDRDDKGRPNDAKLALQCLDMLNRMDGDYAAMQINTKQQIQKHTQTVNFTQGIPVRPNQLRMEKTPSGIEVDQAIESHSEILESKTG